MSSRAARGYWKFLGRTMGRRLALLKAWAATGELSVRMVVPMAMKKLGGHISAGELFSKAMRTQRWRLSPSYTGPAFVACRWVLGRIGQYW